MKLHFVLSKENSVNPLSANPTEWSNTRKQLFERVLPLCGIGAYFKGLRAKLVLTGLLYEAFQ